MLGVPFFYVCISDSLDHSRVLHKVCDNKPDMSDHSHAVNLQDIELVTYYIQTVRDIV